MMTPLRTATPNKAMKANPRSDVEGRSRTWSAIRPPTGRQRNDTQNQQHLAENAKIGVEQHHHDPSHQAVIN